MLYKVKWTDEAELDLGRITDYYLEKAGLRVAQDVYARIRAQVAGLKTFPHRCRMGQIAGTKEYIVSRLPYMVIVEITDDTVAVLGVVHSSRKYPPDLSPSGEPDDA